MTTHLVIPDSHARPDVPNDRYLWLGKLIMDVRPDVIINLGDLADMKSLCSYDKGTKGFEGRRYRDDIECALDAQEKLFHEFYKYNKRQSKNRKAQYNPHCIQIVGNHEHRINLAIDREPILEGTMGVGDLEFEYFNHEVVSYLDKIHVDGIVYTHCVKTPNSAMMISGKHHANALLMDQHSSITVGHSHNKDYKEMVTGTGQRIHGLVAGCYFEHDEAYASQSNSRWWRGVVLKHNVRDGDYDLEFISIDRIKEAYNK